MSDIHSSTEECAKTLNAMHEVMTIVSEENQQQEYPIAMAQNTRDEVRVVGDGNVVGALAAEPGMKQTNYIAYRYAVRRITPIEGERLQGFADNWTRPCFTEEMLTDEVLDRFIEIHANWKAINGNPDAKRKTRNQVKKWLMTISSDDCPDGPRYKCIGNSMSVNVMQWIGMRIELSKRILENRHD